VSTEPYLHRHCWAALASRPVVTAAPDSSSTSAVRWHPPGCHGVSQLRPSSGSLYTRKQNVSAGDRMELPALLDPLETANLNHWTKNPVILSVIQIFRSLQGQLPRYSPLSSLYSNSNGMFPPNWPSSSAHAFCRIEVFTAVTMKNGVFWDVTPCGFCKNRRFSGTSRLHHHPDDGGAKFP
jgi:hypothetical protein